MAAPALALSLVATPATASAAGAKMIPLAGSSASTTHVTSAMTPKGLAPDGWAKARQTAELTASDGVDGDAFGRSVAVSANGSTAVVGAVSRAAGVGAVYVFKRQHKAWTQTAVLTASDGVAGDGFGVSVALSADGSAAVIGAYEHNGGVGAAYVFKRNHGTWTQKAELSPSDGDANSYFGVSVGVSSAGSTAIVGAHGGGPGWFQGAAYIFSGKGKAWSQTAELTAADGSDDSFFGHAVALSGDGATAVVGAEGHNDGAGAAYVFTADGQAWSQSAELTASDAAPGDQFGQSVAASSDGFALAVGANDRDTYTGAAYVFAETDGTWSQSAELTASDGAQYDQFGYSVAMSGDGTTVAVGANGHSTAAGPAVGAVYVFRGQTWKQAAELTASDGGEQDQFGVSVSLNARGHRVVIGAENHDDRAGGAYTFSG